MIWPFRKRKHRYCPEEAEAKAAKIEAEIDLDAARKKHYEVSRQTAQLRQINRRNHFSESLTRAFREGHT